MMYSRKALEYVVLHEICHLRYMNHSKKFWAMVEYYMPDYKDAEKELVAITEFSGHVQRTKKIKLFIYKQNNKI